MNNFTVTGEIHANADTILYRGVRAVDQARVALKLPRSQHPTARQTEKLRYEYMLLRELELPGVVKAYGLEKHEGVLGLVMEDLEGETLGEVVRSRRLDLKTALEIAASLAETLAAIHRRRVIHKDINPRNIVINPGGGQVTIIDFGLASRLSQEDPRARRPGALEGTLAYISPEQTGRMNRTLDRRTDLYSLGVTLYEMLSGRVPFSSADPMELVHSHIARRPTPPRELSGEIPSVVSELVMKLLSKAAEDRYQSARGLALDLRQCLAGLARDGEIAPFPLARHDHSGELRLPQRLYGREAETKVLLDTFERASQSRAELLLIKGFSGVGKSVLVNELQRSIARQGGALITGKFDQQNRTVPYAPIAAALRELIQRIFAGSKESLDHLRAELLAALSPTAQLLIDIIPELGLLLGPQPAVAELGPAEAQSRFTLAFQRMLRVFATKTRPLAIFLDDLQWVDQGSLKLLQILLTDPETAYLLLIGAYRDNEVDAAHPLSLAESELRKSGASLHEITLQPLDPETVVEIVADTLSCDRPRASPLAALIFDKTRGNPFFMGQLLKTLHREGRLTLDEATFAWAWDMESIRGAAISDNVVTLMTGRLEEFAPATQRTLKLAACIGHQFDLRTLSIIEEQREQETAASLWQALREGLIVPLDPEYRFVHLPEVSGVESPIPSGVFNVSYQFLHDRVQQAAYALIEDQRRQEVHLRIGRLMLASRGPEARALDAFILVHHLNIGEALITDPAERLELSRLNLAAGKRAKAGTAYDAAAGYFSAGLACLRDRGWSDAYDLTFTLSAELAECQYLTGRAEEAAALFDVILRHTRTALERAHIYNLQMILSVSQGRFDEALSIGRMALKLFGVDLPEDPAEQQAAITRELAEVAENLRGRRVSELLDAPPMVDPGQRMVLRLIVNVYPPTYNNSPLLMVYLSILPANISLKYGNSEASPFGYSVYGFVLAAMGQYKAAFEFGRLALDLNERLGTGELTCRLHHMFGMHISYHILPLRDVLSVHRQAVAAGPASGDLPFLSYSAMFIPQIRLAIGDPIPEVEEETEKLLSLLVRLQTRSSEASMVVSRQVLRALTGRTHGRRSLSDDAFDEASHRSKMETHNYGAPLAWYHTAKLMLHVLDEDFEGALALAPVAEQHAVAATGIYFTCDLSFYICLTLLSLAPGTAAEEEERAAMFSRHRGKIDPWASSCPDTFLHKKLILEAEEARQKGDVVLAMDRYDEAIKAAREHGFSPDEALANELAARFYQRLGKETIARAYFMNACAGYKAWGATAKVAGLKERYGDLTAPQITKEPEALPLDLLAVINASQAISGEIDLARLVTRLMTIAVESAGAERGYLLTATGDDLRVEAEAAADPQKVNVARPAPGAAPLALPGSILNYVLRSKESVLLHDAAEDARFSGDAYIAAARPKSVLCLPLLRRSALVGVLYLENNLTAGAFTPERFSLLQVLSTQAAISLENAVLYADLSQENAERRRAEQEVRTLNSELERRVEVRTAQLAEANKELEAFSYSVSHDLKTPLRAIEGFSLGILEDHGDKIPAEARDSLLRVRKASLRMSQLIEDLLTLSRVTRTELKPMPVDLSALAREITADLQRASPGREVTIVIADGVSATGDDKLLRIALENLLGNAFKFTSKHARARIEFGADRAGDGRTTCFVRDDGAGFDMKYSDGKLFGTFQRMHKETEFAGTGVGLSTVRRIINKHGGRIWAEGAVEQGATFYFTL